MVKGSSSESDESSERWRWDGRAWWYKVDCKGLLNSRLRRRVSRAVSMALEQESKRWREGLVRLRERREWLESGRDQRDGQNSMWISGASGSVPGSGSFRGGSWDSRSWGDQFM